ncbi:MAG: nucleotidyltransferase family protein [Planctomycetota bacterium]|nr:MAG: nucleotidyltransferase family protein [Planctomycetota bacterium]
MNPRGRTLDRPPYAVRPLVLAAGASSRMGRPKASLPFGPETALGRILSTCAACSLSPPQVVAGAHPDAVHAAAAPYPTARVVVNEEWARGRTVSIRCGLEAVPPEEGVLLWPVDCPLPGAEVVRTLLAAAAAAPEALGCVPSHGGRRGHPLLLAPAAVRRLAALGPNQSARTLVRALHAEGRLVHVPAGSEVLANIDTPEAYRRALEFLERA